MPPLPENLHELAIIFENGQLPRYNCCDITIFRSCVQDIDGKNNMIFACPVLTQNIINMDPRQQYKIILTFLEYLEVNINVSITF